MRARALARVCIMFEWEFLYIFPTASNIISLFLLVCVCCPENHKNATTKLDETRDRLRAAQPHTHILHCMRTHTHANRHAHAHTHAYAEHDAVFRNTTWENIC